MLPFSNRRVRVLMWLAAALLAGCASVRSVSRADDFAPSLSVAADPPSAPLAEGLLNAYESLHPQAALSLLALNRENALSAVESGEADAAILMHPPQGDWFHTPVGRELIVIIAHPGVPADNINRRGIRALYSGQVTAWSGENEETLPVQPVVLEKGASTTLAFDALVLHGQQPASSARVAADVDHAIRLVESTPGGLGIAPLNAAGDSVKLLAYEDVEPTPDSAREHQYALVTDVVFVAAQEPTGAANAFLDWVLSEEGQAVVWHHMLGFDE